MLVQLLENMVVFLLNMLMLTFQCDDNVQMVMSGLHLLTISRTVRHGVCIVQTRPVIQLKMLSKLLLVRIENAFPKRIIIVFHLYHDVVLKGMSEMHLLTMWKIIRRSIHIAQIIGFVHLKMPNNWLIIERKLVFLNIILIIIQLYYGCVIKSIDGLLLLITLNI